jgi:GNAT superfamily N-acetyltransferase
LRVIEAGLSMKKRSVGKTDAWSEVTVHPLTPRRWDDVERLFGERGACAGCWCMWWRLKRSDLERQKGEGNRRAFRRIVESGEAPGLLAYMGGEPIAWCAVAPRERYPTLERSRTLGRVDDRPVWSVTCFFVARPFRRQGITVRLLQAAVEFARRRGARIVEGYPVAPKSGTMPGAFAWTGFHEAFRRAGFVEVLRRSRTRPIMRRVLER